MVGNVPARRERRTLRDTASGAILCGISASGSVIGGCLGALRRVGAPLLEEALQGSADSLTRPRKAARSPHHAGNGQVAQSVEQGTENPCVECSIHSLPISFQVVG